MAGICGWVRARGGDAHAALGTMVHALVKFDDSVCDSSAGDSFGMAVAGADEARLLLEHRGMRLAVQGHPLWQAGPDALALRDIGVRLVDAYVEEGEQALRHLAGDFAIALVNPAANTCLLAVDRIGIRNLTYHAAGGGLLFGSTSDAILAHPAATRAIDEQQIYNYVHFHMVPGPHTVFRGHLRVLPGHFVHFRDGHLRTGAYWRAQFDDHPLPRPFGEMKTGFMEAIERGVRLLSLPEGCGAFLSGGTDSSTVSGLLGKVQQGSAHTYSIGFASEGYDEMEYARIAARHFHTEHNEYYVTPDDVVTTIPKVAAIYDQPFGNASAVPTFHCASVARRQGMRRLLAGDGGDELYGGNARYAKQAQLALYDRLPALLRHALVEPAARILPQSGPALLRKARSYVMQASMPMPARYEAGNLLELLGPRTIFTDEFLAAVDPSLPHRMIVEVYEGARTESWLNRLLVTDWKFTLADNDLPKVTRMCELAGIDVAFPMLYEEVIDFSTALAPELKLKGTQLRYFFKQALHGFLPDEILAKQKHGFGLPVGPWLQSHGPLHALAGDALDSLRERRIVRPELLSALLDRYLKEHASYYGTLVWILMMLELWFQKQGTHAGPAR